MGLFETSAILAVLAASRKIEWAAQAYSALIAGESAGAPGSAAAGVDMQNSVKCLVAVYSREEAHRRTARYSVTAHDAATTYNCDIGSNVVPYVNGGDTRADQAIRGMTAAINGVVPVQSIAAALAINAAGVDVTSTPYDGSTAATITATEAVEVLIQGVNENQYTLDVTVSGGAGTAEIVADPDRCSMRIYTTRKLSAGASHWLLINDGKEFIDRRGWTERLTVNGYKRLYVEIYDCMSSGDGVAVQYNPGVFIGAAVLEQ